MTEVENQWLSICVPTFNRSRKLGLCLKSIECSVSEFVGRVEIIVADNCSSDETKAVVDSFSNGAMNLTYFRHSVNIGAEANFWFLWQAAQGTYVWLVGDDDTVDPAAINRLFTTLINGYDLVILNYSRWNSNFEACQNSAVLGKADEHFHSADDLLGRYGGNLGFISIVVIRKSLLQAIPRDVYHRQAATGFAFMYGIYTAVRMSTRMFLLSAPLVKNRVATTISYDWDSYFISGVATVLLQLHLQGYSSGAVRSAKNRVLTDYVAPKLKARRLAREDLKHLLKTLFSHYGSCARLWFVVLPIVVMPGLLLNGANYLSKLVRRR